MKVAFIKDIGFNPIFENDKTDHFIQMFNKYLLKKGIDYSALKQPEKIMTLRKAITHCQRCSLRKECKKPVPPLLIEHPKVMFVARNPGAQEDREGTVMFNQAPSGKLLEKYLEYLNVRRDEIVITNSCHCHTLKNHPPDTNSRVICSLWKVLEWDAIDVPKYIFVLGNEALKLFMGDDFSSISKVHGKIFCIEWQGEEKFIIPMYHPGYVLRRPEVKRDVLEILKTIKEDMEAKA